MRRREFIGVIGGALVELSLAAPAQEAGRTYRLGCLSPFSRDNNPRGFNVLFFDGLRHRGFIEGQNLTVDYRAFAPHPDLISQYAAELVVAQPDVIYVGGGVAIRAVQQATKSIPIVGITDDMVREGLVHASGAAALNVLASPMLDGSVPLIMERVAAPRLPAIYQWPGWAELYGGFIGYGPPNDHLADLTARFAASLLRGTMPADLPVEQPTKFELVINLKTAKAMGVTVPEALLARADKVIE